MVKNPRDFNQLTINHPPTSYIPEWVTLVCVFRVYVMLRKVEASPRSRQVATDKTHIAHCRVGDSSTTLGMTLRV